MPQRLFFALITPAAALFLAFQPCVLPAIETVPGRWPADRARQWHARQPWLAGANFVPSTAINQLEMWQAETFDPETIDRELGWAAGIGMNAMRVFLHDIPWQEDPDGYLQRIDAYLAIAHRHNIRTLFVFFDGVWNPTPHAGAQPAPRPFVHNSGWVQSPGAAVLGDPARHEQLRSYVQGIMGRFAEDQRVLGWDLFNEPDNGNGRRFQDDLPSKDKHDRACELLTAAFHWAREIAPNQPLTAGVWGAPDWLDDPEPIEQISLANSDIVSFHTYDPNDKAREVVSRLAKEINRPLWCTEYMARGAGSTFEGMLPAFQRHRVAAFNWGLVEGRSQTIYPWDSWRKEYKSEPALWFHDIFRRDGTPYRTDETDLICRLTRKTNRPSVAAMVEPPTKSDLLAGIERHDRALLIKGGWIRDPYILKGPDGRFYLTGTTPPSEGGVSSDDPFNTGLGANSLVGWEARVWRSADLAEWEPLGSPYTLLDGVWPKVSPKRFQTIPRRRWRLWAPELHWLGSRWALVHTSPAPVDGANLSTSEGPDLAGPWSNPMGEQIAKRHDPSLFFDNGRWWMIWGATKIAPLEPDLRGLAGDAHEIGPSGEFRKMGHEGCFLRKFGDKYVLFGTGWSTGTMRKGSYNLYYAVADSITGPYGPRRFAGRFLGHGTLFQDQAGRWWCTAFYNANVPPVDDHSISDRDLSQTAQTINPQGTTIVPMEVVLRPGKEPTIRAKDPRYAVPGPDEAQDFSIRDAE